jgi:hypothetical protein
MVEVNNGSNAIHSNGSLSVDSTDVSIDLMQEEAIPSTRNATYEAKKSILMQPPSKKCRMNECSQDGDSVDVMPDDSSYMSTCSKEPVSFK